MLQERRPSLSIIKVNHDVVGIEIKNPRTLRISFWKDLLREQIENCNEKRTFRLTTETNDPNKESQDTIFTNQELRSYLQISQTSIDFIVNTILKAVKVTIKNN